MDHIKAIVLLYLLLALKSEVTKITKAIVFFGNLLGAIKR